MAYTPRIVDAELRRRLAASGAVVIEGPKACGKTATARQCAVSEVLLDTDRTARDAVAIDPSLVLDGPTPRLVDEWQIEPDLWNHVRRAVDDRGGPGQFVLTGSAVPADDATRHTGAGRFSRLRMRPMTLDLGISAVTFGFSIALTDWNLASTSGPRFSGLNNLFQAFRDPFFLNALINMVAISFFLAVLAAIHRQLSGPSPEAATVAGVSLAIGTCACSAADSLCRGSMVVTGTLQCRPRA